MFWFSKRNWNVLKFTVIAYIVWAYFCVERMLHIFTVKLLSSNRNGFLQYISTSLARLFNLRNLWCPQSCAQKLKINPILKHIHNAECPLLMSTEVARAHISRNRNDKLKNRTRKKMKSSRVQWVNFHAQIAYCLKTEALVVLSMSSISSRKSNLSRVDEHWGLTFQLNRVRCIIFGR